MTSYWEHPSPTIDKDEPLLELIDNSDRWSSFAFRPVFKKSAGTTAKYQHYCLPTGCIPVEKNADGRCIIDDSGSQMMRCFPKVGWDHLM